MSLTAVLGFFFTALTMFCPQLLIRRPVWYLLLRTPVVTVFFRTFQIAILAMANVCVMALIDFPFSLSFKIASLIPINSSWFLLFNYKCNWWRQNPKLNLRVHLVLYCLNTQYNRTHLGGKKGPVTCSNNCVDLKSGWVQTKGAIFYILLQI